MKLIPLLMFSILSLSLSSCGKKEKKSSNKVQVSTYYVQGNPQKILAGSALDKTSFLTELNHLDFQGFELVGMIAFAERGKIKVVENVEAGNEAPSENLLDDESSPFIFRREGRFTILESAKVGLSLRFETIKGRLELVQAVDDTNTTYPVEMLHYSLKNNKEAFSFLFAVDDEEDGKNLVSLTFVKPSPQLLKMTDSQYLFMGGPGVKVQWDNEIELSLCGTIPEISIMTFDAGKLWMAPLKDRLNIKITRRLEYPPFSDLNAQCMYNVDSYITQSLESRAVNPAITIPIIDRFKGSFVDADILVWNQEILKIAPTVSTYYGLKVTIAHEIGHVLGLHHQFEDNIPSIMGYDNVSYLTNYDVRAIQELYPLKAPIK